MTEPTLALALINLADRAAFRGDRDTAARIYRLLESLAAAREFAARRLLP